MLKVSKITIDVIMHNLEAICKYMATTLISTAYSPIFYDAEDFSTALFNYKGELIAQNIGCPVHLAAMPASVNEAIKEFEGEMEPGDVILINDPFRGGTHVPDFTFISPLFLSSEMVALSATRAHVTDCGSAAPVGDQPATHVVQEGLRIPPIKLYSKGKPVMGVLKIILSHTRMPDWLAADIRAAVASNDIGKKFLESLYHKYGREVMEASMEEILNYAERRIRKNISEIPEGTYTAEDYIESDGLTPDPVLIKATITIRRGEMTVDWTGTSSPVPGPLNRPKHAAIGDTIYALKTLLDPKGPANSGMFRPINVIIPENCLLNAKWPSPVGQGNLATTARITDVIWQALAPVMADRVEGMTYGGCDCFEGGGIDPETGKPWVICDMPAGGWGGRSTKDGWNSTWHLLGNCKDTPIEIAEVLYPIRIVRRELRRDSGGPGKFRGGLGAVNAYLILRGSPELVVSVNRTREGPPGIFGGKPGAPGRIRMILPNGEEKIIAGRTENGGYEIWLKMIEGAQPGTVFILESAGGGGYGDPLERDPQRVLEDVIDEYVSLESAERDYGVVIDPNTLTLNMEATLKLREKLQKQKRAM